MKTRRHHNNKGILQIKRGSTYGQLKRIVKRLKIGETYTRECGRTSIRSPTA